MIQIKNVSKKYEGTYTSTEVLNEINFDVAKGEFVAIMGKSGCGKSTLLNILGCMDDFQLGEYKFNNRNIKEFNSRQLADFRNKNIGFVFQSFHLINDMTAVENVELPMGLGNVNKKEMKTRALELLKLIGMSGKENHFPHELSGGEQQRVAIARALSNNPEILLADEPTGNLDEVSGKQVMDLLKKIKDEQGISIIMVTHDHDVAELADRKVFIKNGKITT